MNNVTFIEIDGETHAIIDRGNGEFTSMLKSTYDAMQVDGDQLQRLPSLERCGRDKNKVLPGKGYGS